MTNVLLLSVVGDKASKLKQESQVQVFGKYGS